MSIIQLVSSQIKADNTGVLRVSSRDVAATFGKDHKDVLRAIRNLLVTEDESTERNFAPSTYVDPTGRTLPEYLLNRDAFTLLVMGFTGDKALEFKRAYIAAFNDMEAKLKAVAVPPPTTLALLEGLFSAAKEQEARLALVQQEITVVKSTANQALSYIDNHVEVLAQSQLSDPLSSTQVDAMLGEIYSAASRVGWKPGAIMSLIKQWYFPHGRRGARTWKEIPQSAFAECLQRLKSYNGPNVRC